MASTSGAPLESRGRSSSRNRARVRTRNCDTPARPEGALGRAQFKNDLSKKKGMVPRFEVRDNNRRPERETMVSDVTVRACLTSMFGKPQL